MSRNITYSATSVSLALLCGALMVFLPTLDIAFACLMCLSIALPYVAQIKYIYMLISYVAVVILSFLIFGGSVVQLLMSIVVTMPYMLIKLKIDVISSKWLKILLKIVVVDILIAVYLFLFSTFVNTEIFNIIKPYLLIGIIVIQPTALVFDFVLNEGLQIVNRVVKGIDRK